MTESRVAQRDSPASARAALSTGQSVFGALRDRANTVLPGLYAWVTTVLMPSFNHGAPGSARAFCLIRHNVGHGGRGGK